MSQQEQSDREEGRHELPIERGFPIELINDISERENYGGARQHYRPCYTMHKWWAPRTGAVFRAICLYTLLDDPETIEVREPGTNGKLSNYSRSSEDIAEMMDSVSMEQPGALWPLYGKDVRVNDKKVLDP
jgi:adenine-specific DNA methylase